MTAFWLPSVIHPYKREGLSPGNRMRWGGCFKFDLKKIAEKGYDTVIPMIFTDPEHQPDMSGWELRKVRHGERL